MPIDEALHVRALTTLLKETLFRADDKYAYLLNARDPGLVDTLGAITAETASTSPGPNRKPVVSHANHVLYGLELANRTIGGEEGVYESANWDAAWKLESVSASEWKDLVDRLDQQSKKLVELVGKHKEWNEITLTGAFSLPAHTAYHIGAIRQILLDIQQQ